jgi:nucleotide-binding universal stress UspA family protein
MVRARTVESHNGDPGGGVVVVGIDGSAGAKEALRFAVREAQLRRTKLRAVHAWQYGYVGATGLEGSLPVLGGSIEESRRAAEAALDEIVHTGVPDGVHVEIEQRAVQGRPASVLVDESRGAELLVVGSRGHGGFAGLLLGSVSQQCAHHASCPVTIVRAASNRK